MNKMAGFLTVALLFVPPLFAEETEYTGNSFPRLSYITGNTYIQRAVDLAYEEGAVNMPISEGDRLGTTDGRAEVYLGKGNYVRLDKETKMDFLNLPRKGQVFVRMQVWTGNVYLSIKSLEEEKAIEVHTSDVSIYLLERGIYRIDVRRDRETEIFVYKGMAEASGEDGSVLIKDEQRLEVSSGRFTSHPTRFYALGGDTFDRWSEQRDSQTRKRLARAYLPEELEDFEHELARYGHWVYIPPYGYVWVPGGMDASWRPYYYGRWTWLPLCGWTWIPYEPWGWVTFHYGRWHWRYGLGWYWIPTTIWGPAWVSWYWGYDYFGWAPLTYYGYPGVFINNIYYVRYDRSDYPPHSRALTVIHKNQLTARDVSRVALSQESIQKLGKITLSTEPIGLRPAAARITPEKLGSQKLLLKKMEGPTDPARVSQGRESGLRKQEPAEVKRVETKASDPVREDSIRKIPYGYPSSPEIRLRTSPRKITTRKPGSFLDQIYKSHPGSRTIQRQPSKDSSSQASRETGSKRISTGSKDRGSSSSSSSAARGSSSRSSGSSSSGKVTKKK